MKKFTKSDLREKDLVQLRSEPDCLYMVIGDRLLTTDGYMPLEEYNEDLECYQYDEYGEDEFPYDEYDIVKVIRNVSPWNFRCLQTVDRTPILMQYVDGLSLDRDKFDYDEELEIVYDRYKDTSYIPDAILETIKMVVDRHKSIEARTQHTEYQIEMDSDYRVVRIFPQDESEEIELDALWNILVEYMIDGVVYNVKNLRPLSEREGD